MRRIQLTRNSFHHRPRQRRCLPHHHLPGPEPNRRLRERCQGPAGPTSRGFRHLARNHAEKCR